MEMWIWISLASLIAFFIRLIYSHIQETRLNFRREFQKGPSRRSVKCAIVGAGASGLALAYEMKKLGCDFVVFEKNNDIGGIWRKKHYASLRCNVGKDFMTLQETNADQNASAYPSPQEVLRYLERFTSEKNLRENIRFCSEVINIDRQEDKKWRVSWRSPKSNDTFSEKFDCIALAVGQANKPFIPNYPGIEQLEGKSIHSSDFKSAQEFQGKKVLVVGEFSSGCDISQELSFCCETLLSIRRPYVFFIPRFVFGFQFLNVLVTKMGYHFWIWQKIIMSLASLSHLSRTGAPWKKSHTSHLNQFQSTTHKIFPSHLVADCNDIMMRCAVGAIKVFGPIQRFSASEVHFVDGTSERIDAVVWATGFKRDFSNPLLSLFVESGSRLKLLDYTFPLKFSDYSVAFVLPQHPTGPHWPAIVAQSKYIASIFSGERIMPTTFPDADILELGEFQGNVDSNTSIEVKRFSSRLGRFPPTFLQICISLILRPRILVRYLTSSDWGHVVTLTDVSQEK